MCNGVIPAYQVFPKELEQLQNQLPKATLSIKPFCPTKRTVHAAPIIHVNYTVHREALLGIYPSPSRSPSPSHIHDEYGRKVSIKEKLNTLWTKVSSSNIIFWSTTAFSYSTGHNWCKFDNNPS